MIPGKVGPSTSSTKMMADDRIRTLQIRPIRMYTINNPLLRSLRNLLTFPRYLHILKGVNLLETNENVPIRRNQHFRITDHFNPNWG
jgi:hypothetical protein